MLATLAVTLALATSALFSGGEPLQLEIDAPLRDLLTHLRADDYAVPGTLTVIVDGKPVRIDGVKISLRGHTSRAETECDFPKLKIAFPEGTAIPLFAGLHSIKLGTHCGEAADGKLTPKYGRLANEHSPLREAFVYHLLAAVEVPTLLARRARVTYRDTADAGGTARQSLVRNALVIEDQDDAVRRVGGTREIVETEFANARDQLTPADTIRLAFAEAMIGNFDWCLKMTADDTYRCDARHPLWNIVGADRGGGKVLPLIYDFDVAGIVTGRHLWFKDTFARAFAPSASETEIAVIAQLQRARALFARKDLDEARAAFVAKKPQAFQALASAELDPEGAAVAKRYLDAFYAQIESDENFYRPVVRTPKTQAYAAADGKPACGDRSVIPAGTRVSSPLQRTGERVQVMLLDALWHWTGATGCDAIRRGPVWIDANAIGTDFPPR
jgi:hypothetical protein